MEWFILAHWKISTNLADGTQGGALLKGEKCVRGEVRAVFYLHHYVNSLWPYFVAL